LLLKREAKEADKREKTQMVKGTKEYVEFKEKLDLLKKIWPRRTATIITIMAGRTSTISPWA